MVYVRKGNLYYPEIQLRFSKQTRQGRKDRREGLNKEKERNRPGVGEGGEERGKGDFHVFSY